MSIAARRSHRGDEYQVAVAVHWVICLLRDSSIHAVQVDAVSLPNDPTRVEVDDVVVTFVDGTSRHVQAKKHQGDHRAWEISDPVLKEELVKADRQLRNTPTAIIEFCSQTPFGELGKLIESMRDFADYKAFESLADKNLQAILNKIQALLQSSAEEAFNLLSHFEIGSSHNQASWHSTNVANLEAIVTDAETSLDVIERLVRRNQSGLTSRRAPLSREEVVAALVKRGVHLRNTPLHLERNEVLKAFSVASADLSGWKTTLPNDEWLERPELEVLKQRISEQSTSLTLLLGEPGCGKSALLTKLARDTAAEGMPVLAIKADYLSQQVTDIQSLGKDLGLPADPVVCALALAKHGKVLVLLDQLDALAEMLVQHSHRLRGPLDLIRRLSGVENVHIVASCRLFEHRHDTRLRNLEAEAMILGLPAWEQVDAALNRCGISAAAWNASIREDLRSPQTLNLFLQLTGSTDEESLLKGYQHMLGALWKTEVLSDASGRLSKAVLAITDRMSEKEMLWLPDALFDSFHAEIDQLVRRGMLVSERGRLGFRHQTFYEYIRVRMFLDAPGKLTEAVLANQHSLRVRPLLWHSLAYIRSVDPRAYAIELDRLWNADLRRHLKMLLIEFLGQLQDPSTGEASHLVAKWDDPWYRNRILATIAGSPGWFDRLAGTHVSGIMRQDLEEAHRALPVLCQALRARQSQVLGLVEACWFPDPQKDELTWIVLQNLPAWDDSCISLCQRIVGRSKIPEWQFNHLLSVASAALPQKAPLLVKAWLQHETKADGQGSVTADIARAVLNDNRLNDLSAIAEAAPEAFLEAVWPWTLQAIEALARDSHPFIVGYRDTDSGFSHLDDEDARIEKPFPASVGLAVGNLAKEHPSKFLAFLHANQHVDLMPVHQLLAWGLTRVVAEEPALVLDYLLRDPRRLAIGTYRDVHSGSKRLIEALVPHLDATQMDQLERTILVWNRYRPTPDDDAATRLHRLRWSRERRLKLLRAIPKELLSQNLRRHVEEEERALPGVMNADIWSGGMHEIGSPMTAANMHSASDAQILNLFAELTDETRWDHPRHDMQGGVIQASRQLAEFAKAAPERAIGLIRTMAPGSNGIAVGAVIRALGEVEYAPDALYSLIMELHDRGFDDGNFRNDVADATSAVVNASNPLPGPLFDLLLTWLTEVTEDAETAASEEEHERSSSILWSHSGITILPHGNYPLLAALSRACLSAEPPSTDSWLSVLELHLSRKERLATWEAMVFLLRWLWEGDQERAQRFVLQLFEVQPGLFESKAGIRLLAECQHWVSLEAALQLFNSLLARRTEFCSQAAGEILMLRLVVKDGAEPEVVRMLQSFLQSEGDESVASHTCTGISYTVAELWKKPNCRLVIHPYLMQLLSMHDMNVLKAAAGIFDDRKLRNDDFSRGLLALMQNRPDLLRLAGNDYFGECLTSLLEFEPLLVASVASAMLESIGDDFPGKGGSRYMLPESLLTVALHLQEMGGTHQEVGAQIFERILEFNTTEVRSVLIDLDKRTPNSNSPSPPRRRRIRR